jgi:hypothetical protein
VQWFEHGRPIGRFEGTYADKHAQWTDTVAIDDVSFSGTWHQGLSGSGRQAHRNPAFRSACAVEQAAFSNWD